MIYLRVQSIIRPIASCNRCWNLKPRFIPLEIRHELLNRQTGHVKRICGRAVRAFGCSRSKATNQIASFWNPLSLSRCNGHEPLAIQGLPSFQTVSFTRLLAGQNSQRSKQRFPVMNKPTENSNSTSMPANGITSEIMGVAVIETFPRIQDVKERETPIKYGEQKERLLISNDGQTVEIDSFFFLGPKVLKLKKIKPALNALKKQGAKQPNGSDIDSKWFNDNVRDPFHKVLKFAARHSLEHGEPVSLAFSRRKDKTGVKIVTVKHGFEHRVTPPSPEYLAAQAAKQKAIADKATADAVRAAEKAAKKEAAAAAKAAAKVARISPLPNPVTGTPEPAKA